MTKYTHTTTKLILSIFLIAVPPLLHARKAPDASNPASQQINEIESDFKRHLLKFSPDLAYNLGLQPREAKLPDISDQAQKAQISYFESLQGRLERLAKQEASLSIRERLVLAQLKKSVEYQLHNLKDWHGLLRDLGDNGAGMLPTNMTQEEIFSRLKPETAVQDWKEIIQRLQGVDIYLAQHQENLRRGLAKGFKPDRRILQTEIDASEESANFFKEEMLKKAQETLPPVAFTRIKANLRAVAKKAQTAYQGYTQFLKAVMAPQAGETFTLGREEYAWRIKQMGIEQSPEELHQTGLDIAQRIRGKMEELAHTIDPSKDLPGVMAQLKLEYPKDDKELFRRYEEATERAQKFVAEKGLFDLPKDYKLKIIETPTPLQAIASKAAYFPAPPLDPTRSGAFLLTPTHGDTKKMQFHNHSAIPSVAVHEAFPGHDLQFYFFQHRSRGASNLPFYLQGGYASSLNVEGYALYAEELMRRHGFYTPKEELSQLQMQIMRAYRIVLDTGLHTGKMGFQEAAQTFADQVFLPMPAAQAETLRYTAIPTQAITYMVGRLQIERLKKEYQQIMGPHFDEREFHHSFFEFGQVPPGIMGPVMLDEARAKRANLDKAQQPEP